MSHVRHGNMPIEFAVFLPVLLLLFGFILTMTSASLTRLDTEMTARKSVWENRHQQQRKTRSRQSIRYRNDRYDLANGSRVGALTNSDESQTAASIFHDLTLVAEEKNFLLASSLDYQRTQFQNRGQLSHDRLSQKFLHHDFSFMAGIQRIPKPSALTWHLLKFDASRFLYRIEQWKVRAMVWRGFFSRFRLVNRYLKSRW